VLDELTGMLSRVAEHELQYRVLPTQALIPAGEVRAISGKVLLPNVPGPKGVLSPQFTVERVFAGDTLDYWDAR
jgi:hypothetical protein